MKRLSAGLADALAAFVFMVLLALAVWVGLGAA